MTRDVDTFSVDPDELDDVIRDLEKSEASLEQITTDLERQMNALHDVWEGLAARAHSDAHQRWTTGMGAMRQSVVDLRTAARSAHENYTTAGQANLDMWSELG